jgi:predicted AlkP superfamily phosphohydrolase/phosphomutase
MDGVFVLYSKRRPSRMTKLGRVSIYDIAPIILNVFDIEVPNGMQGRIADQVSKWIHL